MIAGLHIEATNLCTLKCPGCARTQFIKQWPNQWKNYSLDIDQTMSFLDLDLTGKKIAFCGDYGDPIYHPNFIEFVRQFKKRGAYIVIDTNGSYKTKSWWEELVSCLDNSDTIQFSIDGLPENFTQYRINADWESIKQGIDVVSNSTVRSVWKFIPFLYNQDDIEKAQQLATELNITEFEISLSDRFDDSTEYLKPKEQLLSNRYLPQTAWKTVKENAVNPQCQNGKHHYISAAGYYSPCCFLADHRFYYKTIFGKHKKEYDIRNNSLTEILNKPSVLEFYKTLDIQPGCQYNCPG